MLLGVVFFSADGSYEVTIKTKATVYYTGLVMWQPPAVYKSSCSIDVEFFPYDVQTCVLKLGSWTYDGFKVTLQSPHHQTPTHSYTHVGKNCPGVPERRRGGQNGKKSSFQWKQNSVYLVFEQTA